MTSLSKVVSLIDWFAGLVAVFMALILLQFAEL